MDLLAIGGPHATKGFGRAALGSAQARAETAWRGIVPQRSCSAYRLRCQFRHAVAECLATTRHRFPPGAILSGSSEKTHATPRASAGPDLASRSRCQWLPYRIVDDKASGGSDSKELPRAVPFQHRWPTPASARVDAPEARRTCFGAGRKGPRALEAEGLAPGKKNAARLGAHLVFADESGFLLAPLVVKTWAPQGCTPLLRHRQGRRDKISVISGISLSPERHRLGLYYLLFYDNIAQEEVCVFLRELLRHLRGPVIALLDNSSTHQGEPLRKLLLQHPRLSIEHFPSYAPELNPDEAVWSLAKRPLANGQPQEVDELMEDVIRTMERIRSSRTKLRGCVLQSDLPLFCASYCII